MHARAFRMIPLAFYLRLEMQIVKSVRSNVPLNESARWNVVTSLYERTLCEEICYSILSFSIKLLQPTNELGI
jgi:hypothetical protein